MKKRRSLFICFNNIHYLQYKSYCKLNPEKKVYLFGPNDLHVENKLSFDKEKFNPGSFKSVLTSKHVTDILNFIQTRKINELFITCMNNPLFNIVASSAKARHENLKVFMYYDGFINYVDEKISWREYYKDVCKFIVCKKLGYNYTIRNSLLSGKDLTIFNSTTYCEVSYLKKNINISSLGISKKYSTGSIIYICVYSNALDDTYLKFFEEQYNRVRSKFPDCAISVIVRHGISADLFPYAKVYKRQHWETAESICMKERPDMILGDVSSALFNLKVFANIENVYTVGLLEYCNKYEPQNTEAYIKIMRDANIKRLNL